MGNKEIIVRLESLALGMKALHEEHLNLLDVALRSELPKEKAEELYKVVSESWNKKFNMAFGINKETDK